jgi:hypothetical protein
MDFTFSNSRISEMDVRTTYVRSPSQSQMPDIKARSLIQEAGWVWYKRAG